jgi:hypothetical protein
MKRSFALISNSQPQAQRHNDNVKMIPRIKAHVDGSWHCLVYLKLAVVDTLLPEDQRSKLIACRYNAFVDSAISQFCESVDPMYGQVHDAMPWDEQIIREPSPHISLSKPFILHQHEINPFLEYLARSLSLQHR